MQSFTQRASIISRAAAGLTLKRAMTAYASNLVSVPVVGFTSAVAYRANAAAVAPDAHTRTRITAVITVCACVIIAGTARAARACSQNHRKHYHEYQKYRNPNYYKGQIFLYRRLSLLNGILTILGISRLKFIRLLRLILNRLWLLHRADRRSAFGTKTCIVFNILSTILTEQ